MTAIQRFHAYHAMQQTALTLHANHTTDTHVVRSKQKLNKLEYTSQNSYKEQSS
jgi:hypothetical protein